MSQETRRRLAARRRLQPAPHSEADVPAPLRIRDFGEGLERAVLNHLCVPHLREREIEHHPLGADSPVTVGELPDEQAETFLEPVVLGDRQHRRQSPRSDHHAPRDRRCHLREGANRVIQSRSRTTIRSADSTRHVASNGTTAS